MNKSIFFSVNLLTNWLCKLKIAQQQPDAEGIDVFSPKNKNNDFPPSTNEEGVKKRMNKKRHNCEEYGEHSEPRWTNLRKRPKSLAHIILYSIHTVLSWRQCCLDTLSFLSPALDKLLALCVTMLQPQHHWTHSHNYTQSRCTWKRK